MVKLFSINVWCFTVLLMWHYIDVVERGVTFLAHPVYVPLHIISALYVYLCGYFVLLFCLHFLLSMPRYGE